MSNPNWVVQFCMFFFSFQIYRNKIEVTVFLKLWFKTEFCLVHKQIENYQYDHKSFNLKGIRNRWRFSIIYAYPFDIASNIGISVSSQSLYINVQYSYSIHAQNSQLPWEMQGNCLETIHYGTNFNYLYACIIYV